MGDDSLPQGTNSRWSEELRGHVLSLAARMKKCEDCLAEETLDRRRDIRKNMAGCKITEVGIEEFLSPATETELEIAINVIVLYKEGEKSARTYFSTLGDRKLSISLEEIAQKVDIEMKYIEIRQQLNELFMQSEKLREKMGVSREFILRVMEAYEIMYDRFRDLREASRETAERKKPRFLGVSREDVDIVWRMARRPVRKVANVLSRRGFGLKKRTAHS